MSHTYVWGCMMSYVCMYANHDINMTMEWYIHFSFLCVFIYNLLFIICWCFEGYENVPRGEKTLFKFRCWRVQFWRKLKIWPDADLMGKWLIYPGKKKRVSFEKPSRRKKPMNMKNNRWVWHRTQILKTERYTVMCVEQSTQLIKVRPVGFSPKKGPHFSQFRLFPHYPNYASFLCTWWKRKYIN